MADLSSAVGARQDGLTTWRRIPRRIRTLAAVGVTLLALIACGSSGNGAGTSSEPVSSPSASEAADGVAWAESVCQQADALDASVAAIATSVSIDPGAGDVLDQLQKQIGAAVDTVKGDVADLASAVASVPKGADPALVAASEQLTTDRAALDSSIDALKSSATAFPGPTASSARSRRSARSRSRRLRWAMTRRPSAPA